GIAEKVRGFELASRSGGEARVDVLVNVIRISGPYPAPEPYGVALLVCMAATFYWMLVRRRGYAFVLGLPALAIETTGLSLTYFRALWIGAVIVGVLALGLRPRRHGRILGVGLVTLALVFVSLGRLEQN